MSRVALFRRTALLFMRKRTQKIFEKVLTNLICGAIISVSKNYDEDTHSVMIGFQRAVEWCETAAAYRVHPF